jgi:hypothetical protein
MEYNDGRRESVGKDVDTAARESYLLGMSGFRLFPRYAVLLALGILAIPVAVFSQTMMSVLPVQGTISSVISGSITVTTADGLERKVLLGKTTVIREARPAALGDIKPGDALGVAARRDGNALIATNINIFPKQVWESVRKGQFGMSDGQLMTNALVSAYAPAAGGRSLTMTYNDMTTTISVPDAAPIHRLVILAESDLRVGQTVTVRARSTGDGLVADSIGIDRR